MVSTAHEAMHGFFRKRPQDLTQLLEAADYPGFPEIASAKELSQDGTTVDVLERRMDTAMAMTGIGGEQFVLACEAQGGHATKTIESKRRNWPYYLAYLHEQHKQPVVLPVLCQDTATVKWAQEPMNIGLKAWPTLTVNPLVLRNSSRGCTRGRSGRQSTRS